jgi:hypothetical protein
MAGEAGASADAKIAQCEKGIKRAEEGLAKEKPERIEDGDKPE